MAERDRSGFKGELVGSDGQSEDQADQASHVCQSLVFTKEYSKASGEEVREEQ
jgi:hypothetical protein